RSCNENSCLSFCTTCVFCAGVALLPKPRLASFLGKHSLHVAVVPRQANPLQPYLIASLVFPCFFVLAFQWQNLRDPLSDRFAPNLEYGDGYSHQIDVLFHCSLAFPSA